MADVFDVCLDTFLGKCYLSGRHFFFINADFLEVIDHLFGLGDI